VAAEALQPFVGDGEALEREVEARGGLTDGSNLENNDYPDDFT
jgi:hypothetical protein